jgi:hypothetical protein
MRAFRRRRAHAFLLRNERSDRFSLRGAKGRIGALRRSDGKRRAK